MMVCIKFPELVFIFLLTTVLSANAQDISVSIAIETPEQLWERGKTVQTEYAFSMVSDEIINSLSVPNLKLRKIELKFYSQELNGKQWGHPCVIYLPADANVSNSPERKGKVVIVGQRSWDGLATGPWRDSFLYNYGEPIAALTGYPTMICPVPGEFDESPGLEISIGFLRDLYRETNDPVNHNYFRLALPYIRAMDVMADILEIDSKNIKAIIGGHSKRATSAYLAAAIESERVKGLVYMGNESNWGSDSLKWSSVCPFFVRKWVNAEVLYLGGTNEDGYTMFGINEIQKQMKGEWTLGYFPNYRHASMSEKHFINWRMWVHHIFEERPVSRLSEFGFERIEKEKEWGGKFREPGTLFRVKVESPNRIIQAKVWYVYNDDEPYWRDLMWYPEFMVEREDGYYEGYVTGKTPDAWLVELKDIAGGTPSYISSLPMNITGKDAMRKSSRGSRSRNWKKK